jgi:hypothetical protein
MTKSNAAKAARNALTINALNPLETIAPPTANAADWFAILFPTNAETQAETPAPMTMIAGETVSIALRAEATHWASQSNAAEKAAVQTKTVQRETRATLKGIAKK